MDDGQKVSRVLTDTLAPSRRAGCPNGSILSDPDETDLSAAPLAALLRVRMKLYFFVCVSFDAVVDHSSI